MCFSATNVSLLRSLEVGLGRRAGMLSWPVLVCALTHSGGFSLSPCLVSPGHETWHEALYVLRRRRWQKHD